ncbi:glutamine-hydrolyzing carbamoyl-phosphate synthase small subunit [Vallitalea pronyensis]|uniref:Carbamoyl phosphate synthase small chain n=1 Tax=Vallitalea pronyensis TaxID=1348613 RepID=A0A8J8SHY8_9FIRM|nr:glutamine-hydrolyzing carbamoyl-phosphate synthase small subunit [Vallitalea pronyensis]QUI23923.1 glutamine-hydrolyzing carbamoyl-phosphate synthase small subunit [Vallitalea pronyensis]
MDALLVLEDGTVLTGKSFGATTTVIGELVFNTGMTGYTEILTDPSYKGQVVMLTYPLIGNYGINDEDMESSEIQVSALVVKSYDPIPHHWQCKENIHNYLVKHNIPGIYGIDTRMLTKKIRTRGTMKCMVTTDINHEELLQQVAEYPLPTNVVEQVSIKNVEHIGGQGKKIGVIDLGVKRGIIKQLRNLGCDIHVFPQDTPVDTIMQFNLDALLFSNGPGDPKDAVKPIETAKALIGKLPIWGICLGHQILALALGGDTYKLKFGHRGSNHPVIELQTNKVFISSQNHGYAVDESSFTNHMVKTFENVNDHTVEGFNCLPQQIYTVQFHPEEGPGPEDCHAIFHDWLNRIS